MIGKHNTFIAVPSDVSDADVLKRFLDTLVEKIDVAFSKRGDEGFASASDTVRVTNNVIELSADINSKLPLYVRKDSSNLEELHYASMPSMTDMTLVPKKYVDDKYIEQNSVDTLSSSASLSQVIDKVNELITKLNNSKLFI